MDNTQTQAIEQATARIKELDLANEKGLNYEELKQLAATLGLKADGNSKAAYVAVLKDFLVQQGEQVNTQTQPSDDSNLADGLRDSINDAELEEESSKTEATIKRLAKAAKIFTRYPHISVLHFTADDMAFFKPEDANLHARTLGNKDVEPINRPE